MAWETELVHHILRPRTLRELAETEWDLEFLEWNGELRRFRRRKEAKPVYWKRLRMIDRAKAEELKNVHRYAGTPITAEKAKEIFGYEETEDTGSQDISL